MMARGIRSIAKQGGAGPAWREPGVESSKDDVNR
jgi:hypothetical protein